MDVMQAHKPALETDVLRLRDAPGRGIGELLSTFGLHLRPVADSEPIEGSFWGDEEAGLAGSELLARQDTPLHSILHEACHYICMTPQRRHGLHTDAGGDYDEENAVCYLQILLADQLPGFDRQRMCADMDRWGYSFRLGSAAAWFAADAADARDWLLQAGIIDELDRPTGRLRDTQARPGPELPLSAS